MRVTNVALNLVPLLKGVGAAIHAEATAIRGLEGESDPHLIVALDSSGSMGEVFESVKTVLCTLYDRAEQARPLASSTLFVFSDRSKSYDLSRLAPMDRRQLISGLSSGGGTSFASVLTDLQRHIRAGPDKAGYFVVLLTDGCDTCGVHRVDTECTSLGGIIDGMQSSLMDKQAIGAMNTLGFTEEHDAALLSSLTRSGTAPGTFMYLEDSNDLAAVDTMADLLAAAYFSPPLRLGLPDDMMTIYLEPGTAVATLEAASGSMAAFNGTSAGSIQVTGVGFLRQMPALGSLDTICVQVADHVTTVALNKMETEDMPRSIRDTSEYVHFQIGNLTHSIANVRMNPQQLRDLQDKEFEPLKDVTLTMAGTVDSMQTGSSRTQLEMMVADAAQALSEFFRNILLPAQLSKLTQHSVAQTNSSHYTRTADRAVSRLQTHGGLPSMRLSSSKSAAASIVPRSGPPAARMPMQASSNGRTRPLRNVQSAHAGTHAGQHSAPSASGRRDTQEATPPGALQTQRTECAFSQPAPGSSAEPASGQTGSRPTSTLLSSASVSFLRSISAISTASPANDNADDYISDDDILDAEELAKSDEW